MKAHMNHCVNQTLLLRQSTHLAIRFSHRGQRETRVTRERLVKKRNGPWEGEK